MPGRRCTVAVCNNSAAKTLDKDIIYHSFPKDANIRAVWIQRCKRSGTWNPDSCYVCSVHFTTDDYRRDLRNELLGFPTKRRLKTNAVPSLHLLSPKMELSGN